MELERFILNAEVLGVGVEEGEVLACLFSTVLTVTVVPAGMFFVKVSVLLVAAGVVLVVGKLFL